MVYLVMDNGVYGLTKGQSSPTSEKEFITKTTPFGNKEEKISPLEIAISAGAKFVAQSFSNDLKKLTSIIEEAIKFKGFAFINVFSPCITFNKVNTYNFYKKKLIDIEELPQYDNSNKIKVQKAIIEYKGMLKGILYKEESSDFHKKNNLDLFSTNVFERKFKKNKEVTREIIEKYNK